MPLLVASIAFNYLAGEAIARRGGKPGGHALRPPVRRGRGQPRRARLLQVRGLPRRQRRCAPRRRTCASRRSCCRSASRSSRSRRSRTWSTSTAIRCATASFHYALFVSYFPHLIAGPILHHREMMPQFAAPTTYRLDYANLAAGLTHLRHRPVQEDGARRRHRALREPGVRRGRARLRAGACVEAWGAALAFGLQLYFDFSGYSDMAVGLSKMLGIRMPVNFDSPYKATSIIEFWRRWHMTLSRFLRDYLYIALGGNRRGAARRYVNLLVTMLLGGLWHGAAWTFVLWGAAARRLPRDQSWLASRLRARLPAGPAWINRIGAARRRRAHLRRGLRRLDDLPRGRPAVGASHPARAGRPERPRAAAVRARGDRAKPRAGSAQARFVPSSDRPLDRRSLRRAGRRASRPAWRAAAAPACSSARRN